MFTGKLFSKGGRVEILKYRRESCSPFRGT